MTTLARVVCDSPQLEPFTPYDIPGKPWGREQVIAATGRYTGKVLYRYARSHRGGLQYHAHKDEAFHLVSGTCRVYGVDPDGQPYALDMVPGMSFHVPPGAIHSVEAVTDCIFFEVSTPHFNDRVRVEHQYDLTNLRASVAAPGGNGPDNDNDDHQS